MSAAAPVNVIGQQWANRRRPRINTQAKSVAAAEQISSLAVEKREYYKALLDMKKAEHKWKMEEHQRKMEVLELKKSYYSRLTEE